tara:strand:- start:9604 stop:11196 length:1593 start_codon:yes stop_codon:yes gene_type:complete
VLIFTRRSSKTNKEDVKINLQSTLEIDGGFTKQDSAEISEAIQEEVTKVLPDKSQGTCQTTPPCKKGFIAKRNSYDELCCYVDPKSLEPDKMDMYKDMARDVLKAELVTQAALQAAKITAKVGKTMGGLGKAAAKVIAKKIAKTSTKVATKTAVKTGGTLGTKVMVKGAMGPAGWAMLAFDVMSAALDIWDPAGFDEFVSISQHAKIRNSIEMSYEEAYVNEGSKYPVLASYMYKNPEFMETIAQVVLGPEIERIGLEAVDKFSPKELETVFDDGRYENLVNIMVEEYTESEDYEKLLCNAYAEKHGNDKVKYVENVGCSLTEKECDNFNQYHSTLPEDDRSFAIYAQEYRIRNKEKPGNNKDPNMIDKKHPEKVCTVSGLAGSVNSCKGLGKFNYDKGLCDYNNSYCDKMGLKSDNSKYGVNGCTGYPGAEYAEMIFGKTVTRGFIMGGNAMIDPKSYIKVGDDILDAADDVAKGITDAAKATEKGIKDVGKGIKDARKATKKGIKDAAKKTEKGIKDAGKSIKKVFKF